MTLLFTGNKVCGGSLCLELRHNANSETVIRQFSVEMVNIVGQILRKSYLVSSLSLNCGSGFVLLTIILSHTAIVLIWTCLENFGCTQALLNFAKKELNISGSKMLAAEPDLHTCLECHGDKVPNICQSTVRNGSLEHFLAEKMKFGVVITTPSSCQLEFSFLSLIWCQPLVLAGSWRIFKPTGDLTDNPAHFLLSPAYLPVGPSILFTKPCLNFSASCDKLMHLF